MASPRGPSCSWQGPELNELSPAGFEKSPVPVLKPWWLESPLPPPATGAERLQALVAALLEPTATDKTQGALEGGEASAEPAPFGGLRARLCGQRKGCGLGGPRRPGPTLTLILQAGDGARPDCSHPSALLHAPASLLPPLTNPSGSG